MQIAQDFSFLDNLTRLHSGEEELRTKSLQHLKASPDGVEHAKIIERAMDVIDFFVRNVSAEGNQDLLTIQLLGIRLFNSLASAVKLALSGYYQTSALQQRDVLETVFLLNLFERDRRQIRVWCSCDPKKRLKTFSPLNVRTTLDAQQGFTGKRRGDRRTSCFARLHPSFARRLSDDEAS